MSSRLQDPPPSAKQFPGMHGRPQPAANPSIVGTKMEGARRIQRRVRHCYENRPLQQPLIRHSRHLLAIPAPHFVIPGEGRNPEGRGLWRWGLFSAWGAARSRTLLVRPPDIFILVGGLRKDMGIPAGRVE